MRIRYVVVALVLAGCTGVDADLGASTTTKASSTTSSDSGSTTSEPEGAPTTTTGATSTTVDPIEFTIETFDVPPGSRPHDVAPAADGGVWYTGQNRGVLGYLDPESGEVVEIPLGQGSRPHGVIVDEAGTPWITDGGLNSIVSVDPDSYEVTIFPLPDFTNVNLNTAVFDMAGTLWFTGQSGVYGELDVDSGETVMYQAPGGAGPYGITSTPQGNIAFASLAGSYVGWILDDGEVTVLEPPTADQGARRVWTDSTGAIWVSEWNSGNVSRYVFDTGDWTTWPLPGDSPSAYAVFVDENDIVWLSDFGGNAIVRFDPVAEDFTVFELPDPGGEVRQLHGRPGEVWGAESGADKLIVIRTD